MECFWILAKLAAVKLTTKSANHHLDLVDLMEILGMEMAGKIVKTEIRLEF